MSDTDLQQDELASLKARADRLGISYHPSIGLDKLKAKVAEAMSGEPAPAAPDASAVAAAPVAGVTPSVVVPETEGQKRKRLKNEALALVRIRLTCMNPMKKEWPGEIFTTGNSTVGTIKKFIPFVNADEGWHVPKMMYDQLVARQCQVFYTEKTKNGVSVRKGKLIREFAIEVLPMLSQPELDELARRQAMSQAID